jgi:hypothetical protein
MCPSAAAMSSTGKFAWYVSCSIALDLVLYEKRLDSPFLSKRRMILCANELSKRGNVSYNWIFDISHIFLEKIEKNFNTDFRAEHVYKCGDYPQEFNKNKSL